MRTTSIICARILPSWPDALAAYYWLRVFPTEETYLQALVIANLLLLPPDPV
jgi:hypothetical protein